MRILAVAATIAALVHAVPARAEQKIGLVDLQRALNEVDEGKAAKARLKTEFDQKQKVLDDKQAEFQKLRTDFEKQASVLAETARREREEDLNRRMMDLQSTFAQLQRELSDREREVTRGIFDRMAAIVRELAEKEGFSIVLERNDAGVVFAPPSIDLTNELVRTYNARHKAGDAPAAKKADAKATDKKAKASK